MLGAGDVIQVGLGLAAILVAIAAVAWIARRWLRISPGGHAQIRVLGGLTMGSREKVVLLQVGDTQLLVGVTPGQMRTLHVLETPITQPETGPAAGAGGGFAQQLFRAVGANVSGATRG